MEMMCFQSQWFQLKNRTPVFWKRFSLFRKFISNLKENFTLIIFFFLLSYWSRMAFYNPIYKYELFFLPKFTLEHHLHKIYIYIYMAFYWITWTYFNDVNGGRNILMNSQLKRILFMSSNQKKWNKTEKDRKNMKITTMKVTLVKMRYQT